MTTAAQKDCAAIMTGISSYLDGELDGVECAVIERHCAGCPQCASLVEGLRHTIGLCRELGKAPLPESVRARARDSVRRLLETTKRRPAE